MEYILFTSVVDQTHYDKGRRAKPRKGFYIIICGRFESKLLLGGNSSTFELAYRQPLIRNLSEEFAVSVAYSYQTGQTFVDNIATAFSIGSFINLGSVWNHSQNPNPIPNQNFLAAGGIGFIVEPIQNLIARVDVSIPFVNLADRGNNLQESSVFFSLGYRF